MDNKEIAQRLKSLGLEELIPEIEANDLAYPIPRRRILRMLEVASTMFVNQSTEIMALHKEIKDGGEAPRTPDNHSA